MAFDRLRDWLAELRQLDLSDIGIWPRPARAVAFAAAFSCTLLAGHVFVLSSKQVAANSRVASETDLKREYARKALPAGRLEAVRARHDDMAAEFDALLRQLPKDTEVPGLIEDISRAALANALVIESIDLEAERATGFYMELPIRIAVRGRYHDIGAFVGDVAALSRIVTLHDFEIAPEDQSDQPDSMTAAPCVGKRVGERVGKSVGKNPQTAHCPQVDALRMAILAKTYSYLPRPVNPIMDQT